MSDGQRATKDMYGIQDKSIMQSPCSNSEARMLLVFDFWRLSSSRSFFTKFEWLPILSTASARALHEHSLQFLCQYSITAVLCSLTCRWSFSNALRICDSMSKNIPNWNGSVMTRSSGKISVRLGCVVCAEVSVWLRWCPDLSSDLAKHLELAANHSERKTRDTVYLCMYTLSMYIHYQEYITRSMQHTYSSSIQTSLSRFDITEYY